MQADTAAPIQSAPQASPTQPISYAAPVQTAATAPTVSTNSQWVATAANDGGPSPANAGPDGGASELRPYAILPPGAPIGTTGGESLQGSVQSGSGAPEFSSAAPVPGSTVGAEPTNRPGQLQFPAGSPIQQPGSADLAAWDREQPGLLQRLFPNFAGTDQGSAPRKRSKRSKS